MSTQHRDRLEPWLAARHEDLFGLACELIAIPSENPRGELLAPA